MVRGKGASVCRPWFKLDYFHQYLETIDGVLMSPNCSLTRLSYSAMLMLQLRSFVTKHFYEFGIFCIFHRPCTPCYRCGHFVASNQLATFSPLFLAKDLPNTVNRLVSRFSIFIFCGWYLGLCFKFVFCLWNSVSGPDMVATLDWLVTSGGGQSRWGPTTPIGTWLTVWPGAPVLRNNKISTWLRVSWPGASAFQ